MAKWRAEALARLHEPQKNIDPAGNVMALWGAWPPTRGQVCFTLALLLLVAGWAGWCVVRGDLFGGHGVVLDVREGQARVWLVDNGSFDATLELHVERGGQHQRQYVIDKSTYSTLRLIRYGGRILVANGEFIFAAYDPASDHIIQFDQLPFTVWEGQGQVLDSYDFGNERASMRFGFRQVREQRAIGGAGGGR
jgi:hypothetical protein